MLMYTECLVGGYLTLEPKDKEKINKTIEMVETLDDFAAKNDYSIFDFISNHYENFLDFLCDLADNTDDTFKMFLDDINDH